MKHTETEVRNEHAAIPLGGPGHTEESAYQKSCSKDDKDCKDIRDNKDEKQDNNLNVLGVPTVPAVPCVPRLFPPPYPHQLCKIVM